MTLGLLLLLQSAAPTVSALPPLHGESVAFDAARERLVVYGGSVTSDRTGLKGTWEWDGRGWTMPVDSAKSPPPRSGAAMTYDSRRRQLVLFGGYLHGSAPGPQAPACDTWILDDGRWTERDAGPCPDLRPRNISLVYDARLQDILLVDGPALPGDTALRHLRLWRWSDDAWQLVDSSGPRRKGFSQIAFDPSRGVLVVPVLYGGPDAGVWEWDGRRWGHVADTAPGTRQTYGLTYDHQRKRLVLAGGQATSRGPYLGDVWTWNGIRWTAETLRGASEPPGRGGASLFEDRRNRRLVWFGGYGPEGMFPEIWLLGEEGWRLWSP